MILRAALVDSLAALLLGSGLWHIFRPGQAEGWLSNTRTVRFIGGLLIVFALVSLTGSGWYFRALFVLLAISGIWRFCFPESSIRAQRATYPRWVHGCLMLIGAIAVWALKP